MPILHKQRRIRQTSDTGRTQAWACDRCDTEWAISVIRPDSRAAALLNDLGVAAEEIRRLRWKLTQLIALADDAATLPDQELRDRLLVLATRAHAGAVLLTMNTR